MIETKILHLTEPHFILLTLGATTVRKKIFARDQLSG
jgi:hypothetical protein